jgi:hypothetical protein
MRLKPILVVALLFVSLIAFLAPDISANPVVSQNCESDGISPNYKTMDCTVGTIDVGDVIVVMIHLEVANAPSVTDLMGNSYSQQAVTFSSSSSFPTYDYIFTTKASSSASGTQINISWAASSIVSTMMVDVVQGLASPVISQGPNSVEGVYSSGNSYSMSVSSLTPSAGSWPLLFIAAPVCQSLIPGGTPAQLSDQLNGITVGGFGPDCANTHPFEFADYALTYGTGASGGWPGGATTATTTRTGTVTLTENSAAYAEILVVFSTLTVTQPLEAIATGSASVQTITITSACSPSPTSFSGDSNPHNIVAFNSCTMTLALPAGFLWNSTSTQDLSISPTCASGTCSLQSYTYRPNTADVYQPIVATNIGSGGTQTVGVSGCSSSPSSFAGDGGSHTITATPNCTLTLTLPGGYHWIATGTATVALVTCPGPPAVTCSTSSSNYAPNGASSVTETIMAPIQEHSAANTTYTVSGCSISPGSGSTASASVFTVTQSCYFTVTFAPGSGGSRYGFELGGVFSSFDSVPTCVSASPCFLSLGAIHFQEQFNITGGFNTGTSIPSETNDSYFNYKDNLTASSNGINSRPFGTGLRVKSWNIDGGSNTTVSTIGTVTTTSIQMTAPHTVNFNSVTQYLLSRTASPIYGGTISPNSTSTVSGDTGWYDIGTHVGLTGVNSSGYVFRSWVGNGTGSFTGTSNPATIAMDSPISEMAMFSGEGLIITVDTSPGGIINGFEINSTGFITGSFSFNSTVGDQVNLTAASVVLGPSAGLYRFLSWSDSGARSHIVTISGNVTTYTATFTSSTGTCGGATPFELLQEGCWVPAVVSWYSIPIGPFFFFGLVLGDIDMALFIKSRNVIIAMMVFSIGVGVLGYALPAVFSELAYVVFAGSVAGLIYKAWTLRS